MRGQMASTIAIHCQCNSLQELSSPLASVKAGSQLGSLPEGGWLQCSR